jgi:single-strand DNA-binding protein
MRSINKVVIIGNVTRDPQIKTTPNGQTMATFGIATNRDWVTKDGQDHSSAEFHDVVAWSRLADLCSQHLKKGKLVYVEGYLKTRSWEDESGTKKFRTEVVIHDMIMLDRRSAAEPFTSKEGEQPYQSEVIPQYDASESSENLTF